MIILATEDKAKNSLYPQSLSFSLIPFHQLSIFRTENKNKA